MSLNDIKGVDLASIGEIDYSRDNPNLDNCKVKPVWARDESSKLHLRGPIHVTVALALREILPRSGYRSQCGFNLSWTSSLLGERPELYLTKEVI